MAICHIVGNVSGRLAYDFEVSDDGVGSLAVLAETVEVNALDELFNSPNGFQHVLNAEPPFSRWH